MDEVRLKAISLLDGRNRDKVEAISDYFSEFALIKYRLKIESEYLIFLSQKVKIIRKLTQTELNSLKKLYTDFSPNEGGIVKDIEKKINHDVKAVEYYIKSKLKNTSLKDTIPFIHFGLTSYDINIPAYGLMLSDFRKEILIQKLDKLLMELKSLIKKTKNMSMLGRTHGQPALPTTMGKELAVYYRRVIKELEELESLPLEAKFNGAVGNYNALYFTYPEIDWLNLSKEFIRYLGLSPNIFTTQILPYDAWLRVFDSVKRLNNILIGLCQDFWWYISFEYFLQKKREGEVGSSTMSHKINPITFENAEGNLGFANSQFEFFVRKLSVSRLQRDLSDSTIKRDFGLAFGFTLLAWDSLLNGLERILPNPGKMKEDLDNHWEIFSEGIQTFLRKSGNDKAYELLKEKTRGRVMTKEEMYKLIQELPISQKDKEKLKIKDLSKYLGLALKLAELAIKE